MSVAEVEAASHQSREPSVRAPKLHELNSNARLHFHHGEDETIRVHGRHSSPPSRLESRSPLDSASESTINNTSTFGRHESLSASQSPPRSEHPQYPDLADDNDSEEQPGPSPSTSSPPIMRAAREVNTQQPPVITGTTANSKTTAVTLTSKRASPIPSSPTLHTVLTDASPTSANNHEAPASMPPATAIEDVENKPRPNVTTPVSPPPSPPTTIAHSSLKPASGVAATSTTAPAQSSSSTSNDTTPRPPTTELPREASTLASPSMPNSAISQSAQAPAVAPTARGNSLASLLHARNTDVADASEKRESNGTPPSPDSLPQGGHSRSVSMADSSNTGRDTPMKEIREEDGMEVDQPTPSARGRDGSGGAGDMPPLYSTALPQRRNHTPLPSSNTSSAALASSATSLQRVQPSPSPSTPVPPSSHQSYHARRHSLTSAQSRPYPSRSTSVTQQQHQSQQQQPIPSSQPPPLSPPSQTKSFFRTESGEEREQQQQQYVGMLIKQQEHMEHEIRRLKVQVEDQRKAAIRREDEYRNIERDRNEWLRRIYQWMKEGESLMRGVPPGDYAPSAAESTTYANAGAHPSSRSLGSGSVSLSSAAVSASNTHGSMSRGYEREGPLSAVSPRSPYAATNANSGATYAARQEHPRYAFPPTGNGEGAALSRSASHSASASRPSGAHGLRRSRGASSDDLALKAGTKRLKTDHGEYARMPPENGTSGLDSHGYSREAGDVSINHRHGVPPLDVRTSRAVYGSHAERSAGYSVPTPSSDIRGSALSSAIERSNDSPQSRRVAALSRQNDEDEEFPSPRRQYATPVTATSTNGPTSAHPLSYSKMSPRTESRHPTTTHADDGDADPSLEADPAGPYKKLMELADDDEVGARAALAAARQARAEGIRNGSRSSMNSQDIDEMLAEAVGDGEDGVPRGSDSTVRAAVKPRYRAPNSTITPNPGGTINTFPVHIGPHSDNVSPGQTRSYTPSSQPTPSKFMAMSNVQPAPPVANSRGYVFRNTDAADMEAHTQARTPEELGHRPSHSGSFSGSQTSPPGTAGGPVTMQFLPPQSGPPQPKKVYHNKDTGQVIGSQHAAQHIPSMSQATTAGQGLPASVSNAALTIDGIPKRTCKQCGQPGRYKDNKCVEKWGPGPQGPGTVCDRCRKKMKRVEKRANQEIQAAAANHHQYPLAPAPSASYSQLSSQGSQRIEESQEYGYSQNADDLQSQPVLSRASSQNHLARQHTLPAHMSRHGSYASEQPTRKESSLQYNHHSVGQSSTSRDSMAPPTKSYSGAYTSPTSAPTENRRAHSGEAEGSVAPSSRDGEVDADGDAEMDELMEDEIGAAADASVAAGQRSRLKSESA